MSADDLAGLAALRSEIAEIARGARQIPADRGGRADAASYSFGIREIGPFAEEKFAALVDSIEETLAELAPVAHFETTVDGFTAKTAIDYCGFAASVWSSGATAELVDAHLKSLQEVYAFRGAVTAVIAAVGDAVVAISITVGDPLTAGRAIKSVETLGSAVRRLAVAAAATSHSILLSNSLR